MNEYDYAAEILQETFERIFNINTLNQGRRSKNISNFIKYLYERYDFVPTLVASIESSAMRTFFTQFILNNEWKEKFKPLAQHYTIVYPDLADIDNPWNVITFTSAVLLNGLAQAISRNYKSEKFNRDIFRVLPDEILKHLNALLKPLNISFKGLLSIDYILPFVLCLDRVTVVGHNYADNVIKWLLILQLIKKNINEDVVLHEKLDAIRKHIIELQSKNHEYVRALEKYIKNYYVPQLAVFIALFNLGFVTIANPYQRTSSIMFAWKREMMIYHFEPSPTNMLFQYLLTSRDKASILTEMLNSVRLTLLITRIQKRFIQILKTIIHKSNIGLTYTILKQAISEVLRADPSLRGIAAIVFGTSLEDVEATLFTYMLPLAQYYQYALAMLAHDRLIDEKISGYLVPLITAVDVSSHEIKKFIEGEAPSTRRRQRKK